MCEEQLPVRERGSVCAVMWCIGVCGGAEQCGCLRSDLRDGGGEGDLAHAQL